MTAAEALARRTDPHVWSLDPPDISAAQHRLMSLTRAREQLGEIRWNEATEQYEDCGEKPSGAVVQGSI